MRLVEISEGKAKILVPDQREYEREGKFDPAWAPVFYNTRMVFNRDISVLAVSVISPKNIVDALSATGIRGIRYYLETTPPQTLVLNDLDKGAIELIKANSERNGVNALVTNRDANSLLFETSADYVDVDPFGTPSPFILSSIKATRNNGHVAYTATDLSPLEGKAKMSCKRKYDAENSKLSFSKEVGVRVLIGKIAREAAILEKAVIPEIAFYKDYYYRVILKVKRGAKRADECLNNLGFYSECNNCGFSYEGKERIDRCPKCGSPMKTAGPLWLGNLYNMDFLTRMKEELKTRSYLQNFSKLDYFISLLIKEGKYNQHYFNLEFLSSKLRLNIPPKRKILECLGDASETHFDPKGIKTSKNFQETLSCIKGLNDR
ncbi:N2,N2-dimethylguanosine tRNA methyltransferase [Candidatus Acidianus copahuensis]|uniref:tRNA (guanine(26)-N(2))-dimethyltransferase n=1 Tax=Candidatus Acidianus copahuensis TaxID=1160895 RepID=A0A031LP79_9CREN|nr:tRNA (guanine(10)-N(2))-dimethyltransferase [Candidatus Acidianus copahuensis]EZQ06806.1 N2,N2-dimethylguanosine tRNA methyltransferase [Candidatus Acidianus copahuensis]